MPRRSPVPKPLKRHSMAMQNDMRRLVRIIAAHQDCSASDVICAAITEYAQRKVEEDKDLARYAGHLVSKQVNAKEVNHVSA